MRAGGHRTRVGSWVSIKGRSRGEDELLGSAQACFVTDGGVVRGIWFGAAVSE